MTETITFNPKDFNKKLDILKFNKFEESSVDCCLDSGLTHVTLTNNTPGHVYFGWVCEVSSTGVLHYSRPKK